ncbi:hypothetical protein KA082_00460 [Candidatus Woesebacteria bacterium]|nr:hypothetical protein [Candidatus Woesebacteria bacterium]
MEFLPTLFAVVLIIITIVLVVVGVQLMLVLVELKKTLQKVNTTIDGVETRFTSIIEPLQRLGGAAAGIQTGIRVFETFVLWLNRDKK